jgi:CheY-like chemotaxis protein
MTKILVVDDNATNRKLVAALLSFEGFQAIEAISSRASDRLGAIILGEGNYRSGADD